MTSTGHIANYKGQTNKDDKYQRFFFHGNNTCVTIFSQVFIKSVNYTAAKHKCLKFWPRIYLLVISTDPAALLASLAMCPVFSVLEDSCLCPDKPVMSGS